MRVSNDAAAGRSGLWVYEGLLQMHLNTKFPVLIAQKLSSIAFVFGFNICYIFHRNTSIPRSRLYYTKTLLRSI
jgi:hypothetical protein